MNKIMGAVFGLTVLAASSAASAHVDVAVGVGIPVGVVAPPPPAYVARGPAVVPVVYGGGYGDWRERREWREREWRREHWREHEWRERHWGAY